MRHFKVLDHRQQTLRPQLVPRSPSRRPQLADDDSGPGRHRLLHHSPPQRAEGAGGPRKVLRGRHSEAGAEVHL